jgi:phage baseplate assembly protein W
MAPEEPGREQIRRRLLGWSAACPETLPGVDLGRDLALVTDADGKVDLGRVQGIDNLAQSLTIALTTLLGSDIFNTDFGFDGLNALVEESSPVLVRERVRVSIVQLLRKDPRVRRIVDVNLAGGGFEPPPPGFSERSGVVMSRELDVRVVFETVSLDQPTLRLGKVVAGV